MERITRKDLDRLADRLNRMEGFPDNTRAWTRVIKPCEHGTAHAEDVQNVAAVGLFMIDGAYGGWQLQQIETESGGIRNVLSTGYLPARELQGLIFAYIEGLYAAERKSEKAAMP